MTERIGQAGTDILDPGQWLGKLAPWTLQDTGSLALVYCARLTERVWAVASLMIRDSEGPDDLRCFNSRQTHLSIQSIQSDWSHDNSMRLVIEVGGGQRLLLSIPLYSDLSLSLLLTHFLFSFHSAVSFLHPQGETVNCFFMR